MIHLYYMDMRSDCSLEQSLALYKVLPVERQKRIAQLKNEALKEKRIKTWGFMQYVLSRESGVPMTEIAYTYGVHGKPELADNPQGLHFNLSHCGDYAVLGVSDAPVGVDIECKSRNYQAVAKRCFTEDEYRQIMNRGTEEARKEQFLSIWTRKEAYIKYLGQGMSIPLSSFHVDRIEDGNLSVLAPDALPVKMREEGYCVAVCTLSL